MITQDDIELGAKSIYYCANLIKNTLGMISYNVK